MCSSDLEIQRELPQCRVGFIPLRQKVPIICPILQRFHIEGRIMVRAGHRPYVPRLVLAVKAFRTRPALCGHERKLVPAFVHVFEEMLFEAIGPGGSQESPFPASAYGVCRTFQRQRGVRRRGIGAQGIVPSARIRNCRGIRGAPGIGSFFPLLRCAAAAKLLLPFQQIHILLPLCLWNFQHRHSLFNGYVHVFYQVFDRG